MDTRENFSSTFIKWVAMRSMNSSTGQPYALHQLEGAIRIWKTRMKLPMMVIRLHGDGKATSIFGLTEKTQVEFANISIYPP